MPLHYLIDCARRSMSATPHGIRRNLSPPPAAGARPGAPARGAGIGGVVTDGREPPAGAARRRPRGSEVRIVIAAMPKSGSTWLRLILQSYTKMPRATLAPASPRREQEIDPIYGRGFAGGFVAQHHVRAHGQSEHTLRELRATTVVLLRNVYDHLLSLRDHIETRGPEIPTAYVDDGYFRLSADEKLDFLVAFHLPWVFNFLASWSHSPLKPLVLTYEELNRDTFGAVSAIMERANIEVRDKVLAEIIEHTNRADYESLKNRMVIGRGATEFPPAARARVERMAGFYPDLPLLPLVGL